MSLTRKDLEAMDIASEKIDAIIKGHTETINALKEERDNLKTKADKADALQKELDAANKKLAQIEDDGLQGKYDALNKEFKEYKKQVALEQSRSAKEKAFTEVLKDIGITDEKHIAKVLKYSDIDKMELGEDGKLVDAKDIAKETKTEWSEFITTVGEKGSDVSNSGSTSTGGGTKTKEEILAIKDTAERQKAMAEHHELFGI